MSLYADQVVCDRKAEPHQRINLCVNPRVVTWAEIEPEDEPNIIRGEN